MKPFKLGATILLFASAFAAGQEQDLNLFETLQNDEPDRQAARRPTRAQAPGNPDFTLRGASRFGDNYIVMLNDPAKKAAVRVQWKPNSTEVIEGYTGYRLIDVGSRTASIRMPADQPCQEFPDQGVNCSQDGQTMLLSLRSAAPVQAAVAASDTREGEAEDAAGVESETADGRVLSIRNPFSGEIQIAPEISEEERQAREERQAARAERLRGFQPAIIPDEEIPPGMQRIRTPFGDRLVPEDGTE